MQLNGIYLFETYAPVVHCTTVCLMLFLELILLLKSKQGGIIAAFIHTKLVGNEKLFAKYEKRETEGY